jgi:hypothetical protein
MVKQKIESDKYDVVTNTPKHQCFKHQRFVCLLCYMANVGCMGTSVCYVVLGLRLTEELSGCHLFKHRLCCEAL